MRQLLVFVCVAGLGALGLCAISVHPSARDPNGNPLVELFLSKEAKAASMRLSNLERTHPNSASLKSLRQAMSREPENLMLHDSIALFAEYSDVVDFAEMDESERKKVSLLNTAMLLPRLYKFNLAMTQHSRKWGLQIPKQL